MKTKTFIIGLFVFTILTYTSCEKDRDSWYKFNKTSLIAYYPFDGNANDLSDNLYHGEVNGAILTEGRNNEINGAYLFDGYNDYIELPSSVALNTDSCFSIEAWISNDSITTDGKYTDNAIFGQSDGEFGSDYPIITIEIKDDNTIRSVIRGTSNPPLDIRSETTIEDNTWYHLVIVRNVQENRLAIFINGELASVEESALIGNTSLNDFVAIGANFDDLQTLYHFFCGKIDMFRIWNVALSQSEILLLGSDKYKIE